MSRTTWQLRDHYEILEIPRDATPEEVEEAKRIQVAVWHQGPLQSSELAKQRVQRILEAHRTLKDPSKRRRYDQSLMPTSPEVEVFTDPRQRSPEIWKRMAAWMKDENVGESFLRKMAFQAGDLLERRREPSSKQLPYMQKAWDAAMAEGFDPDALEEE